MRLFHWLFPTSSRTVGRSTPFWGKARHPRASGSKARQLTAALIAERLEDRSLLAGTGTLAFAASSSSVSEGVGSTTVSVTLAGSGTLAGAVVIAVTHNGTAISGTDYSIPSVQVVFDTGTDISGAGATRFVDINVTNDVLVEGSEQFTLSMTSGNLAVTRTDLGDSVTIDTNNDEHAVTINDNDSVKVAFNAGTSSVSEATALHNVVVGLEFTTNGTGTPELAKAIAVDVARTAGTATDGTDHSVIGTQSLTFPIGSTAATTQEASFTVDNDQKVEGNETVTLGLTLTSDGSGGQASLGTTTSHFATITDNDSVAIAFTSASSSADEVTSPRTATLGLAFTTNGTGAVELDRDVVVQITRSSGSATDGTDHSSIGTQNFTFATGATAAATHVISTTVTDDQSVEGTEDFVLGVAITTDNTSGRASLGANSTHAATITDNDSVSIAFNSGSSSADEGTTTRNIPLGLTFTTTGTGAVQLDRDVVVTVTRTGGSATDGTDHSTIGSQALTFNAGSTAATTRNATFTVSNENLVELDETVTLGVALTTDGTTDRASLGATTSHTATITNNDNAVISISDPSIGEGGTLAFDVTITNPVDVSVTADRVSQDGTATTANSDYSSVASSNVTLFAAGSSSTFTVSVNTTGDSTVELNESLSVLLSNLSASGRDVTFTGGGVTLTGTGTITNNDSAIVSIGDVSVTEGNSGSTTMTFSVALSNPVDVPVSLTANSQDGTAAAGSDYDSVTGAAVSFSTGSTTAQTVDVTIHGGSTVELNETLQLVLSSLAASGRDVTFTGGNSTLAATGTITNDDAAVISISNSSLGEGDMLSFDVTITNPVDVAVTANRATQDGTATTADSDYTGIASSNVTLFSAGSTSTFNVTVNTSGDNTVELSETLSLLLSSLAAGGRNVTFSGGGATLAGTGTITNDDNAVISISSPTVAEGGSLSFDVSITNPVDVAVTANRETQDGTATTADSDYTSLASSNVTLFAAGSTSTFTVTVNTTGDNKVELNETLSLLLSSLGAGTRDVTLTGGGASLSGTGTITNNDQALLSAADISVNENGTFTFTISSTNSASHDITVDYSTSGGTATTGTDFTAASGTATIAAGTTSTTVIVTVNSDAVVELNETFFLDLANATFNAIADTSRADISDAQAQATIANDDSATLAINDVTLAEGDSGTTNATFTVTLTGAVDVAFSIDFATANGTATSGTDYNTNSGTLNFAGTDGETETITITINGDTLVETVDDTFFINLSNVQASSRNVSVADPQGKGTITDNDNSEASIAATNHGAESGPVNGVFTVSLTNPAEVDTIVNYSIGGTAISNSDFTALSGSVTIFANTTSAPITVAVTDDNVVELTETVTATITSLTTAASISIANTPNNAATLNITNDDSATVSIGDATVSEGNSGSVSAVFTVTLSKASDANVSVDFATADGTATAGSDYTTTTGTLTINAGETTGTISVSVSGDQLMELSEGFVLDLSNLQVSGRSITLSDAQGSGTLTNDDSATVSIGDASLTEGNSGSTNLSFTVTLSQAADTNISVDYATSDGSALAGSDYTTTTGTLTINAGETTGTILVPVSGDTLVELSESLVLDLSNLSVSGRSITVSDAQGSGTLTNDDSATVSINDVTLNETHSGTTTATFTISLSQAVDTNVTLSASTSDGSATAGSDYTSVSGATVTFTSGSTTDQTVDVTISGDTVVELNETFDLLLSSLSAGGRSVTLSDDTGLGTLTNDDSATLSVGDASVSEGSSGNVNAVFTVTLSQASDTNISVDYATSDGSAAAGTDYTASSGTLTINAGETTGTISVPVSGDQLVELSEGFVLDLSNLQVSGRSITVSDAQGSGTITNDDSAVISLSSPSVTEGGTLAFLVTIDHPVDVSVTADRATQDGTATTGNSDYTALSSSNVTLFAAGSTSTLTINVSTTGDNTVELTETLDLLLSTLSAGGRSVTFTGAGATLSGTGTLTNDDSATVSIGDVSVAETDSGTTTATFTVTLSSPVDVAVTVSASTGTGATHPATAGTDFTAVSGQTVTLNTSTTTQTVSVTITGETEEEFDETFVLDLSSLSAGGRDVTLTDSQGIGTITNDDITIPTVQSSIPSTSGPTGAASVDFTVTFTEDVVNVSADDFSVTATGTAGGSVTSFSMVSASVYTVTVGSIVGTGTLRLDFGSGTDVEDLFGNLATSFSSGDVVSVDRVAPTANIVDVTPDPRLNAVGTVTVDFDEAVSGVDISDFTLTRNGSNVSLSALSVTQVTTSRYTLNLSSVTATEGLYELTLNASGSGIADGVGNLLDTDAADEWVFATTSVTVTAGVLMLNDTGVPTNDSYTLSVVGGNLRIHDPSSILGAGAGATQIDEHTIEVPLSSLTQLILTGGGGDDTLTIDFGGGNPIPSGGLSFAGGSGGNDTIEIVNLDSAFSAYTIDYLNATDGSISFHDGSDTSLLSFTGLDPLIIDGTPTDVVLNLLSSSATTATLQAIDSTTALLVGNTFETTTLSLSGATSLTINSGSGNDFIRVLSMPSSYTGSLTINSGDGNDTLDSSAANFAVTLLGGNGSDRLTSSNQGDLLEGGEGNDVLRSNGGSDTLHGGGGNDSLVGGADNDEFDGGLGNDTLNGEGGTDHVVGATNGSFTLTNTRLIGMGTDVLSSIETASLTGNAGNNTLDASGFTLGPVALVGADGDDTLLGTPHADTLDGGNGRDMVRQASSSSQIIADDSIGGVGLATDELTSIESAKLTATGRTGVLLDSTAFSGSATLEGGSGPDTLLGGAGTNLLNGRDGHDSIVGGSLGETLLGGAGNDTINGADGSDTMRGQAGNDSLIGGSGDDRMYGDDGSDRMFGGIGQDALDGGSGNDVISGEAGNDIISGGAGNDRIAGGDGDDRIDGGTGNDRIAGGVGSDTIFGGSGDDGIAGENGNDSIDGGTGNDLISGGEGEDTLVASLKEINEAFTLNLDVLLM